MKYFLAFMTLMAAAMELRIYLPEPVSPALITATLISIIGTAVGTYFLYCTNRAGDDRDFIARTICLTFPVGVRVVVGAIFIYLGFMVVGSMISGTPLDQLPEHTTWIDVVFFCVVEVLLYWRLWHHLRWVSRPCDTA